MSSVINPFIAAHNLRQPHYVMSQLAHVIAVGTLCIMVDYLMAFCVGELCCLKFRGSKVEVQMVALWRRKKTFCVDQVPLAFNTGDAWLRATYDVFASLLHSPLPQL